MNIFPYQLLSGILLAAIIAAITYLSRSLSRSGSIGAFFLGSVIFGIGGLSWSILLLTFFITSTVLSRIFKSQKKDIEADFSKGSRRDAGQVAANGAIAGFCALLYPFLGEPGWLWAAFAGALAAANADTWATEIGILGRSKPRLLTTGKIVDPGTSGGVSLTGFLAAAGGSLLIGILAVLLKPASISDTIENNMMLPLLVTLAGLAGSLIDSLLGATFQAIYTCDTCKKETEKNPLHICGNPTRQIRGWKWLNNDWVNTFCTFTGSLLAGILAFVFLSSPVLLISNGGVEMKNINISSPAFSYDQPIPVKFSCNGENISPELSWQGIPAETRSLALIADDPDAPMGTFTHWVIYNLPSKLTGLPEGVPSGNPGIEGTQGLNSARQNGYMGPCPPAGRVHHYFFKLYALDLEPDLAAGLTAERLSTTMAGHILAQGEWMGTFQR